jgi:uncharacterized protein
MSGESPVSAAKDDLGKALLTAARDGDVERLRDLLERGAAIDHRNAEGRTALFLAASHPATLAHPDGTISFRHDGHDAVVRELLARGAETEYGEYPEFGGRQAVSAAAAMDNVAAVLALLDAGARFLSDENVGVDLLNRLAARGNVTELLTLLDRGGDSFAIDEADNEGRTALSTAIAARQHVAVLALLDRGAAIGDADRAMIEEWLLFFEAQAEESYDKMDDAYPPGAAAGHYANAKDLLSDGIALARRLHQADRVARLEQRLAHIKAVFRSQFSG